MVTVFSEKLLKYIIENHRNNFNIQGVFLSPNQTEASKIPLMFFEQIHQR